MGKSKRVSAVNIGDIATHLMEIVDTYAEDVALATKDALESLSEEGASELRSTSPKDSGEYARDWTWREEQGNARNGLLSPHYVIYNEDHYRLTHLLNNGHKITYQKRVGSYASTSGGRASETKKAVYETVNTGRKTKGDGHILKVQQELERKIVDEVKRRIEEGA